MRARMALAAVADRVSRAWRSQPSVPDTRRTVAFPRASDTWLSSRAGTTELESGRLRERRRVQLGALPLRQDPGLGRVAGCNTVLLRSQPAHALEVDVDVE